MTFVSNRLKWVDEIRPQAILCQSEKEISLLFGIAERGKGGSALLGEV